MEAGLVGKSRQGKEKNYKIVMFSLAGLG